MQEGAPIEVSGKSLYMIYSSDEAAQVLVTLPLAPLVKLKNIPLVDGDDSVSVPRPAVAITVGVALIVTGK